MNKPQEVTESGRLLAVPPLSNRPWHVLEISVTALFIATILLVRWVG